MKSEEEISSIVKMGESCHSSIWERYLKSESEILKARQGM
jgi:hypothetical protein